MKRKLFWLLGFIASMKVGQAQDTLKLKDALEATLKNNKEILLATLDQESAVTQLNQTNAVFLPQVELSYTALVTNNPLNAFGFKLQQQSVALPDFNPQVLNDPPATENYTTNVEWLQPLLNPDMIYQRKAARNQVDVYCYKTKRTKEYLVFEVQKAYAQLQLAHQATFVLDEALRTVKAIYETSNDYFEKGYLQKSDLLLVQVQVATIEGKLEEAKNNVLTASDYLSLLMGVKNGPVYFTTPLEKVNLVENPKTHVPEDRADFKALQSALKAQQMMINSGRMSYLPKLNAFANYSIHDEEAFGFSSNSYLVGAQFSWSLFNGTTSYYKTAEQKIAFSKIQEQLNYQKDQGQLELNKTLRQLQDAQFALQQHEISVSQAAEALRILQNRFQLGLVSTNDLLQSQSTLSEEKLLLTEATFKYNTTLAYIQFLTIISEN